MFNVIDMDMRLTSNTTNMPTITAEVTFAQLSSLCELQSLTTLGPLFLKKFLPKKANGFLLKFIAENEVMARLRDKIGASVSMNLLDSIKMLLPDVFEKLLSRVVDDHLKNLCEVSTGGLTADANDFHLMATNGGRLTPGSNGTANLDCPMDSPGFPGFVDVTGTKFFCTDTKTDEVRVICEGRQVTITMGDNGSATDDIFEVSIDGKTVLTSSSPVRSISVTLDLPIGRTTVVMSGRAAPDGIGTYYIRFSGATVISGATSGRDLVPGTHKTIVIEVQ